jgi:hypothetical protein
MVMEYAVHRGVKNEIGCILGHLLCMDDITKVTAHHIKHTLHAQFLCYDSCGHMSDYSLIHLPCCFLLVCGVCISGVQFAQLHVTDLLLSAQINDSGHVTW